jgi:hypothetical protein
MVNTVYPALLMLALVGLLRKTAATVVGKHEVLETTNGNGKLQCDGDNNTSLHMSLVRRQRTVVRFFCSEGLDSYTVTRIKDLEVSTARLINPWQTVLSGISRI